MVPVGAAAAGETVGGAIEVKLPGGHPGGFGSLAEGGHVRVTVGEEGELKLAPEPAVKELEHLVEKD